jgi:hypothetical protein
VDLVVLGDSFAAGVGTTQGEIFACLLETRYGRRVYNLSFQAIGPWGEYLNWMLESPDLEFAPHATVLWVLYSGNDLEDVYGPIGDLTALPWTDALGARNIRYRTFWGRSVVRNWMEGLLQSSRSANPGVPERMLPGGRRMLFYGPAEAAARLPPAELERHPNLSSLERTMAEMKRQVEQMGLDLRVVLLPTKGEVYPWIYEERELKPDDLLPSGFGRTLTGLCERLSLRCWDTKLYLIETALRLQADSGAYLWWLDDSHLNGRGHEAVATFIAERILSLEPRKQHGD